MARIARPRLAVVWVALTMSVGAVVQVLDATGRI
jgi:hypothetical protein